MFVSVYDRRVETANNRGKESFPPPAKIQSDPSSSPRGRNLSHLRRRVNVSCGNQTQLQLTSWSTTSDNAVALCRYADGVIKCRPSLIIRDTSNTFSRYSIHAAFRCACGQMKCFLFPDVVQEKEQPRRDSCAARNNRKSKRKLPLTSVSTKEFLTSLSD